MHTLHQMIRKVAIFPGPGENGIQWYGSAGDTLITSGSKWGVNVVKATEFKPCVLGTFCRDDWSVRKPTSLLVGRFNINNNLWERGHYGYQKKISDTK